MFKYFKSDKKNILYLITFNLALRVFLLNSPSFAYFDEKVFYLEGARSYLTGFTDPNFEHPPLGKEIIGLGIKILGDNLWGWRLPAVIMGTVGVVATYLLAKSLFKSTKVAFLAGVLLTFDTMWFVNSRIGTIEIFQASFILLTSYFFWQFIQKQDYPNLLGMGSFLGAAVAVKWAAFFLVVGLALFMIYSRTTLFRLVPKMLLGLVIASLVYLSTYLPFLQEHTWGQFWERQQLIYQFHTQRLPTQAQGEATPLQWLTNPTQIYYQEDNQRVISLVNPVLFYGGILAILYWLYRGVEKMGVEVRYLLVLILSLYLPWFLVGRYTWFYYFLPLVPFMAILLARSLQEWESKKEWLTTTIITGNVLGFFLLYPFLVALPVTGHLFQ